MLNSAFKLIANLSDSISNSTSNNGTTPIPDNTDERTDNFVSGFFVCGSIFMFIAMLHAYIRTCPDDRSNMNRDTHYAEDNFDEHFDALVTSRGGIITSYEPAKELKEMPKAAAKPVTPQFSSYIPSRSNGGLSASLLEEEKYPGPETPRML